MANSEYPLEQKYRKTIILLSIVLPLAVAALFGVRIKGVDLGFLPPIYAGINALTAMVLILALIAIKRGNRKLHENFMKFAIVLSCLFLLAYVAYHITSDSTVYGDVNGDGERSLEEAAKVGSSLWVYLLILLTHIGLSIAIIPMVLFTYVKGWAGNIEGHRKWAKITFPIWLYVAISGVIVYFMIAPYYS